MGDPLKKVKSGDTLRIPASTFNTFVDAARDYLERQQGTEQKPTQAFRQTGIVPVKNASGTDAARFAVLGIDSPIFTAAEAADSFANQVALVGVTPTADHAGAFAVLLEPVADGEIGQAVVSGVTPAKVNVTNEAHTHAEVAAGQAGYLASGESGSALILWAEVGTGEKWAVVKIGMPSAEAGTSVFPAKVISSQGSAVYTVREQAHNAQGGLIDKPGVDDVSATNLAELSQGTGSAVDDGRFVLVLLGKEVDDEDEEDEHEMKVSISQIPAAVKATILREAGANAITEIEQGTKGGKMVYEAEWISAGKKTEIRIAEDGTLLGNKVEEPDDED